MPKGGWKGGRSWVRLERTGEPVRSPKITSENIEDPVVPVERNLYGHHLLASCGKENLRKFNWNLAGKKYPIGSASLFTENKDYSYRYTWIRSK